MKFWLNRFFLLLAFSLILFGIGCLIALLISNRFDYLLQDVLFIEGLVVIMVGIVLSMSGRVNFWALSRTNLAQLEVDRMERADPGYEKKIIKHSLVQFGFSSLSILFSGVLLILLSSFMY